MGPSATLLYFKPRIPVRILTLAMVKFSILTFRRFGSCFRLQRGERNNSMDSNSGDQTFQNGHFKCNKFIVLPSLPQLPREKEMELFLRKYSGTFPAS